MTTASETGWWGRIAGKGGRPLRVGVLLIAIGLLSLGDLAMTLAHLTTVGMLEANPVARAVMGLGSPAILAAWKLGMVALAVHILFRARRRLSAEVAAWLCTGVLAWLTVHWMNYNRAIAELTPSVDSLVEFHADKWVAMPAD